MQNVKQNQNTANVTGKRRDQTSLPEDHILQVVFVSQSAWKL